MRQVTRCEGRSAAQETRGAAAGGDLAPHTAGRGHRDRRRDDLHAAAEALAHLPPHPAKPLPAQAQAGRGPLQQLDALAAEVADKRRDPYSAVEEILKAVNGQ